MTAENSNSAVKAEMKWKGRKLLCNGVCVAEWIMDYPGSGGKIRSYVGVEPCGREHATEKSARRAVNRRFRLPLDFGESK